MTAYVEQVTYAPTNEKQVAGYHGAAVYDLTSGANGTELTGTGSVCVISSDATGWFHVSDTVNTDKAASTKTHRVVANVPRVIGGVRKGMFISFLDD